MLVNFVLVYGCIIPRVEGPKTQTALDYFGPSRYMCRI